MAAQVVVIWYTARTVAGPSTASSAVFVPALDVDGVRGQDTRTARSRLHFQARPAHRLRWVVDSEPRRGRRPALRVVGRVSGSGTSLEGDPKPRDRGFEEIKHCDLLVEVSWFAGAPTPSCSCGGRRGHGEPGSVARWVPGFRQSVPSAAGNPRGPLLAARVQNRDRARRMSTMTRPKEPRTERWRAVQAAGAAPRRTQPGSEDGDGMRNSTRSP